MKDKTVPGANAPAMDKKIPMLLGILIALVIIAVILWAAYFWRVKSPENDFSGGEAEIITEDATKSALPSVSNNPLESKPNLNPAEQSNPITEVKINPFE